MTEPDRTLYRTLNTRIKLCPSGKFAYVDEATALGQLERYNHPNLPHQDGHPPVLVYC
jgi:hypothetical protein